MTEKKMIKYDGGCICGEIKFTVKLDENPEYLIVIVKIVEKNLVEL